MEDTKVADIFTEDINNLTEHLNIVINAHNKQLDKIDQLTNNWNELEEWVKEMSMGTCEYNSYDEVRDKMKEIKEGNKWNKIY